MNLHHWFPIYYGASRFRLARLKRDRLQTQVERPEVYPTIAAAFAAAKKLNRRFKAAIEEQRT